MNEYAPMRLAIQAATLAATGDELPFGCVIVHGCEVIARAAGTGTDTNPTKHCEIAAIQKACAALGGLLYGCTLYSTHQPCAMCCGAINHAKLSQVVYGTRRDDLPYLFRDTRYSAEELLADTSHPADVVKVSGELRQRCIELWDDYYKCAHCHTIKHGRDFRYAFPPGGVPDPGKVRRVSPRPWERAGDTSTRTRNP